MASRTMRRVRRARSRSTAGPRCRTTADRPVFRGNGANDYVCVECGNLLATGMNPEHMGRRVRIKCGRCRTVNIAAEVPVEMARRRR